jgi:hypothetical protein
MLQYDSNISHGKLTVDFVQRCFIDIAGLFHTIHEILQFESELNVVSVASFRHRLVQMKSNGSLLLASFLILYWPF